MSSTKHVLSRIAIFSTGVALGLSTLAASASAVPAAHNPGGNNGTIKVDGVDYDDDPANQPHVDCIFQIDFFGFDEGDRADVRFFAQPPSGTGELLHEDLNALVSTDDAGGGPNDVDESLTYDVNDWDVSALTEKNQGYHVKVEANVVGAPGGAKQKVFWIDCDPAVDEEPVIVDEPVITEEPVIVDEPVITEEPVVRTVVIESEVLVKVDVSDLPAQAEVFVVSESVLERPAVVPDTPAPQALVLAAEFERAAPAAQVGAARAQVLGVQYTRGATLARTGIDTGTLVLLAGLLLGLGAFLTLLGRAPAPALTGNRR